MNEMDLLARMRDNAPRRVSQRVEHTFRAALYENQYPKRARLAPRPRRAQAETISASPDGWQHIQAKDARLSRQHGRSGPLGVGWLARRSVRGRAVLSAGGAAVAATVTTVMLMTAGSAPPALATVTTALTRTLTQSYHLTEQDSSYYIWNGRIRYPNHDTCVREVDPVRHLEASSRSVAWFDYREVGGYRYLYRPQPRPGTQACTGNGYRPQPLFPSPARTTTPPPRHHSRCCLRSRRPIRSPWPGQPRGLDGRAHGTPSAEAYMRGSQSAALWTWTGKDEIGLSS